jgi:hypothetical protein
MLRARHELSLRYIFQPDTSSNVPLRLKSKELDKTEDYRIYSHQKEVSKKQQNVKQMYLGGHKFKS